MLSATAHSTECTSTKIRLPAPRPNQIRASGSSAIAGSGLNIAVMVSRKSVPIRVLMAKTVSRPASTRAGGIADQQHLDRDSARARNVAVGDVRYQRPAPYRLNVGNSSGLSSQRA